MAQKNTELLCLSTGALRLWTVHSQDSMESSYFIGRSHLDALTASLHRIPQARSSVKTFSAFFSWFYPGYSSFSARPGLTPFPRRDIVLEPCRCGGTVDTGDLKSPGSDPVPVRVRPPAPRQKKPTALRFRRGGESSVSVGSFFLSNTNPLRWALCLVQSTAIGASVPMCFI